MTRATDTLAILFADVAKSTHLYEVLGDKIAQSLIGRCITIMSNVTSHYGGRVIKTIGDEVMCTFPSADDAVAAAIDMHQGLEDLTIPEKPGFPPPNIYVGIQYGPVISEAGDVFGDAVNVAARMVSQAKQRQIITTEETVKLLSLEYQNAANCVDKTTIKGKSGEMNIYEVVWEQHDATVMVDDAMGAMAIQARMEITFYGTTITIDENRPTASFGRQAHNDIVVNDKLVSRSHARIEYRKGKFVLIDQSTNGTVAIMQGKKKVSLKRDEGLLLGDGVIAFGRDPDPNSPDEIHYAIKM